MNLLITGGSSDITRAIVRRRSAMGDRITVTASSEESLQQTLKQYREQGFNIDGVVYSFKNPENILEKINRPVQGLILNAFTRVEKLRPFHLCSVAEFREYAQMNIEGNVALLRQVLPEMIRNKMGRVIFISSVSVGVGTKKYGSYCLAKSAIEGLITNLATEYSEFNVLCNTVRLGIMKTSRTELFWQKKTFVNYVNQIIPQAKIGEPKQAAEALDPLLSEECYITGQVINVAGGLATAR